MKQVLSVIVFLTIISQCAVNAQKVETGFLNRSMVVDGTEYLYQIYVPREFNPAIKWPIILSLHGGGEYGNDGIRPTAGGVANIIRRFPDRVPAIVIFPQAHADGKPGWHDEAGRAALMAVDKAIAEFSGDPKRVYLTGYSAGGNGSWYLASKYPDRFAAAAIICAFITEFRGRTSNVLYPALIPASEGDPYGALAKRVAHLPIWIFHGDADPTVSVEESRKMFSALKAIGANVQYTEFPGVKHDAWTPTYDKPELFKWMLEQRR